MTFIKGQILLTTSLDAHNEKLTREELYSLYKSQPKELVINREHDFGRPPVANAKNFSFVQLESGEFAIIADVEVHDEEEFLKCGGFSMSWLADGYSLYPNTAPELEIYFNPRIFAQDDALDLISVSSPGTVFNARELKQKSLVASAIIIIKFVTLAAIAGFFGKFGSDAYDKLISKLKKQADSKQNEGQPFVLHLIVPAEINTLKAEIVLEVPAIYAEHVRLGSLSYESAVATAKTVPYVEDVKKIVIKASGDPPKWVLSHYIKSNGIPVRI